MAELTLRDPERARAIQRALSVRNTKALTAKRGRERERAFFDRLYEMRGDETLRSFYDWQDGQTGAARPLHETELAAVLAEIEAHEGPSAAEIARHWWSVQPGAFLALLDRRGAYVGTMVYLHLGAIDPSDAEADPALASLAAVVHEAPLREGERAAVLRFWIWRDGYQEPKSAAHGAHSLVVGLHWALAQDLAWVALVAQRIAIWRPFFDALGFEERPSASFSLGEHAFHFFARDFRVDRAVVRPRDSMKRAPSSAGAPRMVLSQEDFARAVRDALRGCARPDDLGSSPLLASRLLADWAEDEPVTPAMLRELLEVAASSLDDPRDDRPRRCVELTFLRPAPTHDLAAERLGLTFSTYRRQLARGVEKIVDYLWQREVRGAPASGD